MAVGRPDMEVEVSRGMEVAMGVMAGMRLLVCFFIRRRPSIHPRTCFLFAPAN